MIPTPADVFGADNVRAVFAWIGLGLSATLLVVVMAFGGFVAREVVRHFRRDKVCNKLAKH